MKKKALIIEDDEHLVELLKLEVSDLGYEADTAFDGQFGITKALMEDYAFILLDLNLPDMDGVEISKKIRAKNEDVPIIVLTARTDDLSKVLLIELGADDYLTKPFNPLELKARIKAIFRRVERSNSSSNSDGMFSFKGLEIDLEKRRVSLDGNIVDLTNREYDILALLASKPGRPFSRADLCTVAYGHDVSGGYEKSVRSHVNRLRGKIEPNIEEPIYVLTVRGIGYCFSDARDDDEE